MPIRPENRDRYPAEWPEIRERVRARARRDGVERCEQCNVPNGASGWRDAEGRFHQVESIGETCGALADRREVFEIVCTTAHLNHQPEDNRDENLRFLCQRCHNRHDALHRAATRARVRDERNGQVRLLEMSP